MNKPVRVLHIFGGMNRGGAETFIMNVYRNIDRSKVQFDFAVHTDIPGHYDKEICQLGGRILIHPKPKSVGFLEYNKILSRTLDEYGPFHAVHSHVHYFSGFVLGIAKKQGVHIRISHSHTSERENASFVRNAYGWFSKIMISRFSTHLIGCSKLAAEALYGANYQKDRRYQLIANGIDINRFSYLSDEISSLRQKLLLPLEGPLIGHVGRFSPVKNHHFIIEIFEKLVEIIPSAHLILVGEGQLKNEIKEAINQKKLSTNVSMLGIRDDIPELLRAMDVFLFPSQYEGLPVALVEAQAAGVPCVVSDTVSRESNLKATFFKFVSLESEISDWIQSIMVALRSERVKVSAGIRAIREAGYDVKLSIKKLEKIYVGDN